jgi:AraC family transcriptional regulator
MPGSARMVADACQYMEEHFDQRIRVPELARRAGVSASWFIRAFRVAMNVTPHAYLHRVRLVRAHQMVQRGMPLREVAARTGFATMSHLSASYKRAMGRSPRQAIAKK